MRRRLFRWSVWLFTLNAPLLYLILFALFFARAFFSLDPDFGWHLSSGQYIWQHGIPQYDIYSYTAADFPWIHHEWLADLLNYQLYQYCGGYITLALLYAAMWTGAFWLMTHTMKLRLLVLLAAVVVMPFAGIRAVTWTILLAAVLVVTLQAKLRWVSWLVPIIMLLWANIHGSFVIGLGYLLWYCLMNWRDVWRWVIAGVSLLVTAITPYGLGMYVEVLRTVTDSSLHSRVSEWQPFGVGIGVGVLAGVWFGLRWVRPGRWWQRIGQFETMLLGMAILSARHTPLLVLFVIRSIAEEMNRTQIPSHTWKTPLVQRLIIGLAALLATLIAFLGYDTVPGYRWDREAAYPRTIAAALNATPCASHVFAHYDFGGYLIWKMPGQKLYIDGRMPSWQLGNKKYMDDYIQITNDDAFRDAEFARYDIRCVIWGNKESPFAKKLIEKGWRITTAESTNEAVLLRK